MLFQKGVGWILIENTLFGEENKIQTAIDRLRAFEPDDGYFLAFSGGKDSLCIYYLALEVGVKFTPYYNLTTVDPPELVYFIREKFPNVIFNYPKESMWQLIVRHKIPPTRLIRYCCADLKESTFMGHVSITGVRWAESVRQKQQRGMLELNAYSKKHIVLHNDNEETRRMFETCSMLSRHIVNPIINWGDDDVWEYIELCKLPYCKLYNCGFKRLGCIACPMSGSKKMKWELERYPKYKEAYIRAFDRMIQNRIATGLHPGWADGQDVMHWWVGDKKMSVPDSNQIMLEFIQETQ